MLSAQFDVNAGFDPSSLSSVTAAQFLQMIQQVAPLSNIGFIIVGAGPSQATPLAQGTQGPSVTNNPRFANYIWLNTFALPPVPYFYDGAGNWVSTTVAAGSIVNASISATAEIAVSKLGDGAANEIIVTAGDGVTVQWSSVATLLAALNDSVPLTAIDDTAAVGAESFLRRVGSTVIWKTFAETVTSIQAALSGVNPNVLTPGSVNTILGTNGSGVVGFDTPANILAALSIGLDKLAQGGAVTGDILSWNGSNWAKITPAQGIASSATISTTGVLGAIALNSATLTEAFTHTFNPNTPRSVRVVIRCTIADAASGYQIGDEIDINAFERNVAGAETPLITVSTNATSVIVSRATATLADTLVVVRAGGSTVQPTSLANFTPKVYAWV